MSQSSILYNVLLDGQPHRSDELVAKVYGVGEGTWLARLAARIHDVKLKYGVSVNSWRDSFNPKLWWYQIVALAKNPEKAASESRSVRRTSKVSALTSHPTVGSSEDKAPSDTQGLFNFEEGYANSHNGTF